MPKADPVAYSAADIWGAAVYATNVNGGYIKMPQYAFDENDVHIVVKIPNRDVAKQALADGVVTEQDRRVGKEAQQFLSSRLAMKALSGRLSDFESVLAGTIALEEFIVPQDKSKIGVVNSQIASYQRQVQEESLTQHSVWGYVGEVGMRVDTQVTVASCYYIQQYEKFRYVAITKEGHRISFYNSKEYTPGTTVEIRGTVKKHAENVTILNRVKIKETM